MHFFLVNPGMIYIWSTLHTPLKFFRWHHHLNRVLLGWDLFASSLFCKFLHQTETTLIHGPSLLGHASNENPQSCSKWLLCVPNFIPFLKISLSATLSRGCSNPVKCCCLLLGFVVNRFMNALIMVLYTDVQSLVVWVLWSTLWCTLPVKEVSDWYKLLYFSLQIPSDIKSNHTEKTCHLIASQCIGGDHFWRIFQSILPLHYLLIQNHGRRIKGHKKWPN